MTMTIIKTNKANNNNKDNNNNIKYIILTT